MVKIPLPFQCDPSGFKDPNKGSDENSDIDLGIFPLDVDRDLDGEEMPDGAPPPSTKFLTLGCEELVKAKKTQKTKMKSYFPSSPAKSSADADARGRVRFKYS